MQIFIMAWGVPGNSKSGNKVCGAGAVEGGGRVHWGGANSLETVYIISLPNELRPLHVKCVAEECGIWKLHV